MGRMIRIRLDFVSFMPLLFSVCLLSGADSDLRSEKCDRLVTAISKNDLETKIEDPSTLNGKWVSERCETRSGPEFLLRSYFFSKNDTFRLTQYHYEDESCSVPSYTLNAWGKHRLRGLSWVTPSATEVEYSLAKISILAQNEKTAEALSTKINTTCPGFLKKKWRPFKEYIIISMAEISSNSALSSSKLNDIFSKKRFLANTFGIDRQELHSMMMEDSRCIQSLQPFFSELQLIRIQTRPPGPLNPRFPRQELYLGDIHSRQENRNQHRPTAFQTPLLTAEQARGCEVCQAISRATEKTFPQLNAQARLPVYLGGEWVSGHCESRTLGLFLTRRLQVIANSSSWQVDYKFFSDAACSVPTLTAIASGSYTVAPLPSSSRVRGATEFDFHVEKAFLTLFDEGLVQNLQNDPRCGIPGTWRTGVMHDLAPSNGCVSVGIVVPSTVFELVRLEINSNGMPLLFMGQADTDNARRGSQERPTSYQPPLIQCSSQLPPYTHFISSAFHATGHSSSLIPNTLLIFLFTILTFINHSVAQLESFLPLSLPRCTT